MNKRAFTLIELLIVIAIIGILSGFIAVSMSGATNAAKDGRRKADIDTIRKALLMYSVQNGNTYPIQSTQCNIGSDCAVLSPAISPYLPNNPIDPNGTYYTYQSSGTDCTITANLSTGSVYQYACIGGYSVFVPCTGSIAFTYRGGSVTYGLVTSQTGRCWMDRNLGAAQVATAYNDSAAYGDLFQWGRGDDGHQVRTSGTTSTLSATDIPGHSNFIMNGATPYDWRSVQNINLWQGISGTNNPCPSGWRIPTAAEWQSEITAGSWANYNSAYGSPLKLTVAGGRQYTDGVLVLAGTTGVYWSNSVNGIYRSALSSTNSYSIIDSTVASYGYPVRCIRN